MLTPEDAQYLTEAVSGLASPLHTCLDKAHLIAHEHFDEHDMTGVGYTRGRTDLTRDHARRRLERLSADDDLGGWRVADTRSGRIHLHNTSLSMKILHGTPLGDTPAPGRNQARISYYRNPRLNLLGVEGSNLLAVWNVEAETGELTVRIVRPVQEWKYGRKPNVDLDFVLPRSAEDFGDWQFVPDDEDFTLPFDIDEDEGREGGGRSGA